ncbi:MAG: SUMF1/EgtB/PvdO family nonheme iron enzyme [Planctomycetales bacterium]|nr:SUMF1/EgtB/PvdO family nonheme iron enzyme [Planctomycetales bacterium]
MNIGPYEVIGELGRGGMGTVYRARDPELRREIALKVLERGAASDERARFLREGRTGARLRHPNIVTVHAAGEADGAAFIAQELIEGESLAHALAREPFPPERAARLVATVARALGHAHREGVVHRDVKPGNILLDRAGEPHLADFGLARTVEASAALSRSGQAIGTPHYMSPEQASGRVGVVDARTDVWGCGMVLYECLAAARPFEAEGPMAVMTAIVHEEPVPLRRRVPSVPAALDVVVARCLEKEPDRRYSSADALAEDLERYLGGRPVLARAPGLAERCRRRVRRNPAAYGVGAALGAVALLLAGALAVRTLRERAGRAEEARRAEERVRAQAEGFLAEARAAREEIRRLDEALAKVPRVEDPAAEGGEGESERARLWQEREEQTVLVRSHYLAVRRILREEPGRPEAREASESLGAIAWARLVEAEAEGNREAAARFEALLREAAPERYAQELRGDGTLTLRTDPPGAEVEALQYGEEDGKLVARPWRPLGTTPIEKAPLPMGSYLLVLRKEGCRDVRYPVLVERGEDDVSRDPVPLLTDRQIGKGYVWVPPGEAILGGDPKAPYAWSRRKRWVAGFCLAEREVTFREYREFLGALLARGAPAAEVEARCPRRSGVGGGYWGVRDGQVVERGRIPEEFPVFGISWGDADAYARWRGEVEGRGARLPTEEEWERAARGADGRLFPWGNVFRWERVVGGRSPVHGERPRPRPPGTAADDVSPFGVRDLAGSVYEWCDDLISGRNRAARGGAWGHLNTSYFRAAYRNGYDETLLGDMHGFRVRAEPKAR